MVNRKQKYGKRKPNIKSYIDENMRELESKRIAKVEEVLEYLTRGLRGEETEQVVDTENIDYYSVTLKE
ncbi:terminase small subunit [Clostridium perfringens]|uniref:terminase small subunit n=1 Tax=Clostridium perfringens TaxID=1502 RepID=UPI003D337154